MLYNLYDFSDRTAGEFKKAFIPFPYIKEICYWVERCLMGQLPGGKKNIAIAVPPRHYKTTFISQNLPAWAFAEIAPDCEFILTSATASLATSNAMASKKIMTSDWYQKLYPHVEISKLDKDVQHYFKTTNGGAIYAAGLGGTITGFGAGKTRRGFGGAIIIDDPLKADDASSPTMLENSVNYYLGTLKSRPNNAHNTPFLLVAQRLHPDDLIGWVMKNEPDDWHLVSFPALYDGKVLNPLTTSVKTLETLKEVAPLVFYAQYQQTPMIDGGNIIKLPWWRYYDATTYTRRGGLVFLTADTAFKEDKKSDRSVIQVWEATRDGLYCLDAVYGRWEFPTLLQRAKDLWEEWRKKGAREFWVEDKASGTPLTQVLVSAGIPAQGWKPGDYNYPDDKVSRMNTFAFSVHGGHVFLPRGNETIIVEEGREEKVTPYAKILMEEAAAFARDMSHSHDDHCDAATMADSLWKDAGGVVRQ